MTAEEDGAGVGARTRAVEAGVQLSGHLLSEELGRGGQARVFRAEPVGGGPAVAIKVAVDPRLVEALRTEGEALRRLVGPRFVQVLDERLDDDPPHVVLELCPGGDLAQALARAEGARLSVPRVLELARAILDGVAFAHEEGVVHGDLKPENVLLDAPEPAGQPKLADLGLSRAWRAEQARPGVRGSLDTRDDGKVRGTFDYLAPELRAGGLPSPRSDVFALGVMLHELVLGVRPHGLFRRPSEVLRPGAGVPVELDRIIERALATEPADRYPDAAFMLADLEAGPHAITLEGARATTPVADAPVLLLAVEEASLADGALLALVPALLWTLTPGAALLACGRPGVALGITLGAFALVVVLAGPGLLFQAGVRWRLRGAATREVRLEEEAP